VGACRQIRLDLRQRLDVNLKPTGWKFPLMSMYFAIGEFRGRADRTQDFVQDQTRASFQPSLSKLNSKSIFGSCSGNHLPCDGCPFLYHPACPGVPWDRSGPVPACRGGTCVSFVLTRTPELAPTLAASRVARDCSRVQVVVLTARPHSGVSNRGGIRGSSCANIPRSAERSRLAHSWSRETCHSARSFDRLTMPDRSSPCPRS
jgi:hypothetical protein